MASVLQIRRLGSAEVKAAVALWWVTDLLKPWNDPKADAERALATPTSTILAGFLNDQLVATGVVGSDGHRGWVYYLAVSPGRQRCGFGRQMNGCLRGMDRGPGHREDPAHGPLRGP
ncbi:MULTISPECIES: GNAT family N-acetyltransferase [Sphingobium]|uniref:GNAT family N-acetyltransferase n=1 Tax=Sphingobium psychrophilum TaxID=2728834 RepID=UPI0038B57F16